jgi:hypothetical protein
MSFNLDEEIEKSAQDMQDTVSALIELGFPEDQWVLIGKYVAQAITHSQWVLAKVNHEIRKEDTFQRGVSIDLPAR